MNWDNFTSVATSTVCGCCLKISNLSVKKLEFHSHCLFIVCCFTGVIRSTKYFPSFLVLGKPVLIKLSLTQQLYLISPFITTLITLQYTPQISYQLYLWLSSVLKRGR